MKNDRSLDALQTLLLREGGYRHEIGETSGFQAKTAYSRAPS